MKTRAKFRQLLRPSLTLFRFALVAAVLFLAACDITEPVPVDSIPNPEKWVLNGQLYIVSLDSRGDVSEIFNFDGKFAVPIERSYSIWNKLYNARARTLASRGIVSSGKLRARASAGAPARLAYLLNADGSLIRFDQVTGTATDPLAITCAGAPQDTRHFDLAPDGSVAVIAGTNPSDHSACLTFVDAQTMQIVGSLPLPGVVPGDVAITPDSNFAYLASTPAGVTPTACTLYAIDIGKRSIADTISVPTNGIPWDIVNLSPDGLTAYLASAEGSPTQIPAIDLTSGTVAAQIRVPLASGGGLLAVHPDGTRLYYTGAYGGPVRVIRTSDYSVLKTIPAQNNLNNGEYAPFGSGPVFTPDGRYLFLLDTPLAVSVVDTRTDDVVSKLPFTLPPGSGSSSAYITYFYLPGPAQ